MKPPGHSVLSPPSSWWWQHMASETTNLQYPWEFSFLHTHNKFQSTHLASWFNLNSMCQFLHSSYSVGRNYLFIRKRQRLHLWSLGMDRLLHLIRTERTVTYPCWDYTIYPKTYAHGFVVLCFVVVMQSFIMNSHEVFIHIHQGCFAGNGAIVRLPQCQWSKPDGYVKISQCITTTKHSKAKTVCIFLGIYCS